MTESHEIDCCRPREGDIGSEDLRHHRAGESVSVCVRVSVFSLARAPSLWVGNFRGGSAGRALCLECAWSPCCGTSQKGHAIFGARFQFHENEISDLPVALVQLVNQVTAISVGMLQNLKGHARKLFEA